MVEQRSPKPQVVSSSLAAPAIFLFNNYMAQSAGTKIQAGFMKTGVMSRIRHFISGTIAELGKCTWPDRASVFESTLLVLFMIAVLAVFVFAIDYVSQGFVRLITTF